MRRFITAATLVLLLATGCESSSDDAGDAAPDEDAAPTSPAPASLLAAVPSLFDADPVQADRTYVGRTQRSDAYVAIVVRGDEAAVYVCDGKEGEWFGGAVEGDRLSLRTEKGTRLDATVDDDGVEGTLTFGSDRDRDFTAAPPSGPGPGLFAATGLFRTTESIGGKSYVTGWIILPDGIRGVKSGTSDGVTLNRTSTSPGETVRNQLPDPFGTTPAGLQQFAGVDRSGTLRVGVARNSSSGGVAAFLTNGADKGRWLTGTVAADGAVTLSNGQGDRLQGTLSGGQVTAQGTVAGQTVQIAVREVPAAIPALRRAVQQTLDGKQIEIGLVTLPDGTASSVGLTGTEVVLRGHVAGTEPATSDGTFAQNGDDGARARPIKFLRCASLNARYEASVNRAQNGGNIATEDAFQQEMTNRYSSLGCNDIAPIGA